MTNKLNDKLVKRFNETAFLTMHFGLPTSELFKYPRKTQFVSPGMGMSCTPQRNVNRDFGSIGVTSHHTDVGHGKLYFNNQLIGHATDFKLNTRKGDYNEVILKNRVVPKPIQQLGRALRPKQPKGNTMKKINKMNKKQLKQAVKLERKDIAIYQRQLNDCANAVNMERTRSQNKSVALDDKDREISMLKSLLETTNENISKLKSEYNDAIKFISTVTRDLKIN